MPATPSSVPVLASRRWVDGALVLGGAAVAVAGLPEVGVPVAALGLVVPVLHRWSGRRQHHDLRRLVPAELTAAHAAVLAAGRREPGSAADASRRLADTVLLEVAAVLAGRPVRGAAQRRFVAARLAVLEHEATALAERADALADARSELDAMDEPGRVATTTIEDHREDAHAGGLLVRLVLVLLLPAFLGWELLRGGFRMALALVEGVALRVRAAGRLVLVALRAAWGALGGVVETWRRWRRRVVAATVEARARFVALRLQTRLRLRQALGHR